MQKLHSAFRPISPKYPSAAQEGLVEGKRVHNNKIFFRNILQRNGKIELKIGAGVGGLYHHHNDDDTGGNGAGHIP